MFHQAMDGPNDLHNSKGDRITHGSDTFLQKNILNLADILDKYSDC